MTPLVLIDDDEMVRTCMMRVLADQHHVISFANPIDALAHLQALDYEPIIVCDHEMPEMTGLEVYERLPERLRSRFILHTGRHDLQSPSGHTVYKPTCVSALRDTIRQLEA